MKLLKDNFQLEDDQLDSARQLVTKRRALMVESTGSGKTPCVLYSFAYLYSKGLAKRLVVFAPRNAHEKEVWKPQIERFTNFRCVDFESVEKWVGSGRSVASSLEGYQIIYAKHTSLRNNPKLCAALCHSEPKTVVVVDEVHAFRGQRTGLSASASMVLSKVYSLWGITATDYSVSPLDIYGIVNFVYPNKLGSQKEFVSNYCNWEEKIIGRYSNGNFKKVRNITGVRSSELLRETLKDMLVVGVRVPEAKIHFINYELNREESELYARVANGFTLLPRAEEESWIRAILSQEVKERGEVRTIKDIDKHSSRYVYLQSVVDGALNQDGSFGLSPGSKSKKFLDFVGGYVRRNESLLMYFDYYVSMDNFRAQVERAGLKDGLGRPVIIIETSGRVKQKPGFLTSAMVKNRTCLILCSKASSESENYPFIRHVVFYDVPTTPVVYLQMSGRITRRNTEFPGDLHVWLPMADNIDRYKLTRIGYKIYEMQPMCYDLTKIFPTEYIQPLEQSRQLEVAKRILLWRK